MKEKSLHFPSVSAICSFLKETDRSSFVLLGKKSILIAPFSAEELRVAIRRYGAQLTETAEAAIAEQSRSLPVFQ